MSNKRFDLCVEKNKLTYSETKSCNWIYGNWNGLGWGACLFETDESYEKLDFDPEWECEDDIQVFIKNKDNILKLKHMTEDKYNKLLNKGLELQRNNLLKY